ncbi:MAG: peptidoglycan glycosyltransferase, partial [Lachnospiraceae bacterium]|nr:peptidoglycan glycosyltransferase [Lachnospiraceae bacterium]
MEKNKTFHRKKIFVAFVIFFLCFVGIGVRLGFLMIGCSEYYGEQARELHERERSIKAARGRILDRNGVVLADNKTVCTISVIHSQITQKDEVIATLCRELSLSEEYVRGRVEKVSAIERIKSNVDKSVGDRIREYNLAGVKVDEDFKRYYPYGELASKVLGFTGGDNQGIIGLEVSYDSVLEGKAGTILTMTDARGIELDAAGENRIEPVDGNDLTISMDMNIQKYATQLAYQALETKQADSVSILVMNPQNGELLAMVNVPEFDLNEPFTLPEAAVLTEKQKQDALNRMWRNGCINDTYEPGSTFKTVTAAAGLEAGVVHTSDTFHCPGYIVVEDRRIRCHKRGGHGSEDFIHATMNSCNPVFV